MATTAPSPVARLRQIVRAVLGVASPHAAAQRNSSRPKTTAERLADVRAIGALGGAAAGRIEELLTALSDEVWEVRAAAAKALGSLGAAVNSSSPDSRVAAAITSALRDSHWAVREAASEAHGLAGVVEPEQAMALAHTMRHDDSWPVRTAAAAALARLAERLVRDAWDECVQALKCELAAALTDEDWHVRERAAVALGSFGAASHDEAICALAFQETVPSVKQAAAKTLGMLGTSRSASALSDMLADERDWQTQAVAIEALGSIGESAGPQAAAVLAGLLSRGHEATRAAAARALGRFGQAAAPHASALAAQLRHGGTVVRQAVGDAFRTAITPLGVVSECPPVAGGGSLPSICTDRLRIWSDGVSNHAARFAADLRNGNKEARNFAEEAIAALGPSAMPYMLENIIRAKDVAFESRMMAFRAFSCTGMAPLDLQCSILSEWIYTPVPDVIPVAGLTVVKLQRPQEHIGQHLQWALLRGHSGVCFLVFRGSESALDWIENSYATLRGVDVPDWGVLLMHSGYWSSMEGEIRMLRAALTDAAAVDPIDTLILCGGSKGGANALAAAVILVTPFVGQQILPCGKLCVVTFGAPNIVGRGSEDHGSAGALKKLRAALKQVAPQSRSWLFTEDPVPAIASHRSGKVISQYVQGAGGVVQMFRWLRPQAFEKFANYFGAVIDVAKTLEPIISEVFLESPPAASGKGKFDASVHPQINYTEALCRQLLRAPRRT